MRIGLDIHGVITTYPNLFAKFSHSLVDAGHECHIITGQEWDKVKHKVEQCGVVYTHHFSIVDYHLSIGTEMWQDEKKTWWMGSKTWIRSKGEYIEREKIDIHFDDSYEYGEYIPVACTFVLVPESNFQFMCDCGMHMGKVL